MADFYQTNTLVTLSDICFNEHQTIIGSSHLKIVLVIPCYHTHLKNHAIEHLLDVLQSIEVLSEIVIVLNGATEYCAQDIERLRQIDRRSTLLCLTRSVGVGKGFALSAGFDYVYKAYQDQAVVVTLDADVAHFTLAHFFKLIYPIIALSADFNKGYYTRYSASKLDGRLTRLLMYPLLHALSRQVNSCGLLAFLLEFRYILSGDVAIKSALIPKISIRANWSYDLSLLVSIYAHRETLCLVQTEITQNYQHAHRTLEENPEHGLMGVAKEIIEYLMELYPCDRQRLREDYAQLAQVFMFKYEQLALFNGLECRRSSEAQLIHQLSDLLCLTGS